MGEIGFAFKRNIFHHCVKFIERGACFTPLLLGVHLFKKNKINVTENKS